MLQNNATTMRWGLSDKESCARGVLENLANTLARFGRAFKIVLCTDLLRNRHTLHEFGESIRGLQEKNIQTNLFTGHRPLTGLSKFVDNSWVSPKILLAPNKDDGQPSAEMHHFRNPLISSKG
jgi:hypothetical protein